MITFSLLLTSLFIQACFGTRPDYFNNITAAYPDNTNDNDSSIATAREQANRYTWRVVEGQLTTLPGQLMDLYSYDLGAGFGIQDETDGIWVYVYQMSDYSNETLNELELGRWVTVTGLIDHSIGSTLAIEGGTTRIVVEHENNITIGVLGSEVEVTVVTPGEVAENQGLLVEMRNVTVTVRTFSMIWGKEWSCIDYVRNETTSIYIYPFWDSSFTFPRVGVTYEYMRGFAGVFTKLDDDKQHVLDDKWEVWPRTDDDWSPKSNLTTTTTNNPSGEPTTEPTPSPSPLPTPDSDEDGDGSTACRFLNAALVLLLVSLVAFYS